MNPIPHIQNSFAIFLKKQFNISDELATQCNFEFNVDAHRQQFGDLNSNASMSLSKHLAKNPREIAQEIVANFHNPYIQKLEIAGPGFINAWLTPKAYQDLAEQLLTTKAAFFQLEEEIGRAHV
jgi:arginyl-tRNA synthetase